MRRLELDFIAIPSILHRMEIADKVLPCILKLTELGRILEERVAELDAPVARGDG